MMSTRLEFSITIETAARISHAEAHRLQRLIRAEAERIVAEECIYTNTIAESLGVTDLDAIERFEIEKAAIDRGAPVEWRK